MTGRQLIEDIDRCQVGPGQCGLWWLGQHGFAVKLGEAIIYIDAFLSEFPGRQVPPLLSAGEVTDARLVLGSHDHADHIDRPAWPRIALASPRARFVVPLLLREKIIAELPLPAALVLGVDEGKPLDVEGVHVSAIPAAHEFLDTDAATGLHPHLGFIVEGNGFCLYHAGDCCLYEGLHQRLRLWKLDLMILPINGRDARRLTSGCIGNMTFQEAADLAGALEPGAVMPAHYEMFASNSADPAEFVEYVKVKYPHQQVLLPRHGERILLSALKREVGRAT